MKRIVALILVAVMLCSLSACGKKKKHGGENMVQITFHYQNGMDDEVFYIKKGSIVPNPRVKKPTKDQYVFVCWRTQTDNGETPDRVWKFGTDIAVYDTEIYAYYEPK